MSKTAIATAIDSALDIKTDDVHKYLESMDKRTLIDNYIPELTEVLELTVNDLKRYYIQNLYTIASMQKVDYGVLPTKDDMGFATTIMLAPDEYAFDKEMLISEEDTGMKDPETGQPIMKAVPMTWAEVSERRAAGQKPMTSNAHATFLQICQRALDHLSILKKLKTIGYESTLSNDEVWTMAHENAVRRQKAYENQQELDQRRRQDQTKEALIKATENGGMLDI